NLHRSGKKHPALTGLIDTQPLLVEVDLLNPAQKVFDFSKHGIFVLPFLVQLIPEYQILGLQGFLFRDQ
ncbi:MAG: hypothetical protein WC124_11195, partial [Desulfoplanes sp.]